MGNKRNDHRYHSIQIITEFENTKNRLQSIRNEYFKNQSIDDNIRPKITALTNATIRLKGRLDYILQTNSKIDFSKTDSLLINILRISIFGLIYDSRLPAYAIINSAVELAKKLANYRAAGFVNAILRKLNIKFQNLPDWESKYEKEAKWHSIPNWLYKKWAEKYTENDLKVLLDEINKNPPNNIRFSPLEISSKVLISRLNKYSIKAKKNEGLTNFLKINSGLTAVLGTELFKTGKISIQNPASGAIINLLDPKEGDLIIDACAAPGTKTLQIAEKLSDNDLVLASDINPKRVKMGEDDLNRHNLKNIKWSVKDAACDSFQPVKKILIDAPCSGTGVLARRPDIRWRRKKSDIERFSELQFMILNNMSKYLLRDGIIVYSTCSLEEEENWSVIQRFLNLNSKFVIVPAKLDYPKSWINSMGCIETLPHIHDVDGMFAAKLKRN